MTSRHACLPRSLQLHDSLWDDLEGLPHRHPGRCGLLFLILSCAHRREHPCLYGSGDVGGGGTSPRPESGWLGATDGVPALSADMQQHVVRVLEVVFAQLPRLRPCEPAPPLQSRAAGAAGGGAGADDEACTPSAGSRLQTLLLQTDGSASRDSVLHTCCRCVRLVRPRVQDMVSAPSTHSVPPSPYPPCSLVVLRQGNSIQDPP